MYSVLIYIYVFINILNILDKSIISILIVPNKITALYL